MQCLLAGSLLLNHDPSFYQSDTLSTHSAAGTGDGYGHAAASQRAGGRPDTAGRAAWFRACPCPRCDRSSDCRCRGRAHGARRIDAAWQDRHARRGDLQRRPARRLFGPRGVRWLQPLQYRTVLDSRGRVRHPRDHAGSRGGQGGARGHGARRRSAAEGLAHQPAHGRTAGSLARGSRGTRAGATASGGRRCGYQGQWVQRRTAAAGYPDSGHPDSLRPWSRLSRRGAAGRDSNDARRRPLADERRHDRAGPDVEFAQRVLEPAAERADPTVTRGR